MVQPGEEEETKTGPGNQAEDCQDAQPGAVVGWSGSVSQIEPMQDQEGWCQAGREKGNCRAEQYGQRDNLGCGDCLDAQPGAVVGKSGSVSQTTVVQPGEEEEAKTGPVSQSEAVHSRCKPEQWEHMTGSIGGSTPNAAVPSRGRPEQVEPVGGSAPDETVPSRCMPEQVEQMTGSV